MPYTQQGQLPSSPAKLLLETCSDTFSEVHHNMLFSFIGIDFNNASFTIEVPAETTRIRITNITIVDDNVNEREEVFVLVARILNEGRYVACFQLYENGPCKNEGQIGGIRLRIRDNDGKYCITVYIASDSDMTIL